MCIRKPLLVFLFICALGPGSTLAGTGRYLALGSDPFFVRDEGESARWYTRLLDHPDQVQLELGDPWQGASASLTDLGSIHHGGRVQAGLGRDGRLGTLALRFEDHRRQGPEDGALGVVWGRDLGLLRVALAGHFTTFGVSRNGTAYGDLVQTRYQHRYGGGLGGRLGTEGFWEVAGEVLDSSVARGEALYYLPTQQNGGSYGLRARAGVPLQPGAVLIPILEYTRDDRVDLEKTSGIPVQLDDEVVSIGLGVHLEPAAEQLFVLGFRYDNGRRNRDWSLVGPEVAAWEGGAMDYYTLSLKAAAEYRIRPWLTLAGGVRYQRLSEERHLFLSEGDLEGNHVVELVQTPISLGLFLEWDAFRAELGYNDLPPFTLGDLGQDPASPSGKGYTALTLSYLFP